MAEVLHVNQENFLAEVLASPQPVLVDFWAEWCGPCRMVAPVVEQIAAELEGQVRVAKLNVDENQQIAVEHGVMSIPTLILFRDGREVKRLVGYQPKEQLLAQIQAGLS